MACQPDIRTSSSLQFILLPGRWMTFLSSADAGLCSAGRRKDVRELTPSTHGHQCPYSCCFLTYYVPCSSWPVEMPPTLNQQGMMVKTLRPVWRKCGVTVERTMERWVEALLRRALSARLRSLQVDQQRWVMPGLSFRRTWLKGKII